jgi:tRNA A-37 threonylcarbamoyl transferase component Bud32
MTLLTKLQTSKPVAFGGFSELHIIDGKAVKVLEDGCYRDVLEECYKQNIAAEAGLAPRVHAVAKDGDDKVLIVMDAIDTDVWFNPDSLDEYAPTLIGELPINEMEIGLKLYCQMLKAGIIHADFHSGNWFMNDADQAIAIDFGISSEIGTASEKHIRRSLQFIIPALDQLGYGYLVKNLQAAWKKGLDATRQELIEVANEIA